MSASIKNLKKKFINNLKKFSNDKNRYNFFIYQDNKIKYKTSTHTIILKDIECYFTIADGDWIYFFTENEFNSDFDAWKGDHYTIGILDNNDNFIKLHKTSYPYTNGKFEANVRACDFNVNDYINYRKNEKKYLSCLFVNKNENIPPKNLSRDFDFTYKNENLDLEFIKEFIDIGLGLKMSEKSTSIKNNKTNKIPNQIKSIKSLKNNTLIIYDNKTKLYKLFNNEDYEK